MQTSSAPSPATPVDELRVLEDSLSAAHAEIDQVAQDVTPAIPYGEVRKEFMPRADDGVTW